MPVEISLALQYDATLIPTTELAGLPARIAREENKAEVITQIKLMDSCPHYNISMRVAPNALTE